MPDLQLEGKIKQASYQKSSLHPAGRSQLILHTVYYPFVF